MREPIPGPGSIRDTAAQTAESVSTACPPDYYYGPAALNRPPDLSAETLYVIGGLYGNPEALAAVLAMKDREDRAGPTVDSPVDSPVGPPVRSTVRPPVRLVFNGDFNWFNVDAESFRAINEAVLEHVAIQGNVEAELAREGAALDCGCNYPPYVDPGTVERSNRIFARLKETASHSPGIASRLGGMPKTLVARVGAHRIAIVHGDPEALSGWRLAEEALSGPNAKEDAPPGVPQTGEERIAEYFRAAGVSAFAATHTCLPFARDFMVDGMARLIVNNGAAGMPNFRGVAGGLLTRISVHPALPGDSLYGWARDGVHYDALPIVYDQERWMERFLANWPEGTPAHRSYFERLTKGPAYTLEQAIRGKVGRKAAGGGPRRTA